MDARVHIFTATALGRGRVASPPLCRLYPRWKPLLLILQEAEWTSGPVWARRSDEKSPPLRHPGSNPGRPARSPAPCRLSYLAHVQFIYNLIISEKLCAYVPSAIIVMKYWKIRVHFSDYLKINCLCNITPIYRVKDNKCHPFNSRRGRLKGPIYIAYTIWGLNLIVFTEKVIPCSLLWMSYWLCG